MSDSDGGVSYSDLAALRSDLNNGLASLTQKIDWVDMESRGRDADLEREVEALARNFEFLLQKIDASFLDLRQSVETLQRYTTEGLAQLDTTTASGSASLLAGVLKSEASAREGLSRVSTGLATVDVLKAISDANQLKTTVDDLIEDIGVRKRGADNAVAEKQHAYDNAAKEVYDGLETHLRRIGEHIVGLQQRIGEILESLGLAESAESFLEAELRGVQLAVTQHRARAVADAIRGIDDVELRRAMEWRRELEEFLADTSNVTVTTSQDDLAGLGIALPFVFVAVNRPIGSDPSIRVHGLASKFGGFDAETPETVLPTELREPIGRLGERLLSGTSPSMNAESLDELKAGLATLRGRGAMSEHDLHLLLQQLDRFPPLALDT